MNNQHNDPNLSAQTGPLVWPVVGEDNHCILGEVLDADTAAELRRAFPPVQLKFSATEDTMAALVQRLREL